MHPQSTHLVRIYGLADPSTGDIRYIGQTCHRLAQRLGEHVYHARHARHPSALSAWVNGLLTHGVRPRIILLETCPPDVAGGAETAQIARHLAQGTELLNTRFRADVGTCGRNRIVRPVTDRFWEKVAKTAECWLWTGKRNSSGYGILLVDGRQMRAHRLSYEFAYGPIPDGLQCLHRCESGYPRGDITCRLCVNPDHLYLGTNAQNRADCARTKRGWHPVAGPIVSSERRSRGDRHWTHLSPERVARGEANGGGGKLSTEQVMRIWQAVCSGRRDWTALGREFGVAKITIQRIASGQLWTHVTGLGTTPSGGARGGLSSKEMPVSMNVTARSGRGGKIGCTKSTEGGGCRGA